MSFRNKTCFKTVLRNRNSSDGFKFSMYSDPDLCSKLWKPHKHYKLFFIGNIFFSLTRHVKNCEFFLQILLFYYGISKPMNTESRPRTLLSGSATTDNTYFILLNSLNRFFREEYNMFGLVFIACRSGTGFQNS